MTYQRILAAINRDEFIGRDAELKQITRRASMFAQKQGLVLLAAPGVGARELLKQAYDELFSLRADSMPIYFAFNSEERPVESASRFFQNFLQQFVAYRRVDPSLVSAPVTYRDLEELALPGDFEIVSELIESFENERDFKVEQDFIRFCFNAPQRLRTLQVFQLIDGFDLARFQGEQPYFERVITSLVRSSQSFALAGFRRHLVSLIRKAEGRNLTETLHVERLGEDDARRLLDRAARDYEIEINDPTRDLLVQQLDASPFFINQILQAARETRTPLNSFLNCQRLYVDELLGGGLYRYFSAILDEASPDALTRKTLLRVLYESVSTDARRPSLWAWKKRLGIEVSDFQRLVSLLHIHELTNSSGSHIEVNNESPAWTDYLRARYRIESANEPRALVVATTLLEVLKRAPQTMARHYRRQASMGLRELLSRFDCQEVPASLFHYDRFAAAHKGADNESVEAALNTEADLIRLPQIVYAADCAAFASPIPCDPERCAVGNGFEAADYSDQSEIAWLTVEIDSKLEASRELAEEWRNRLLQLARESGFQRIRLWLIAPEGFSSEAGKFLEKHDVFSSSRRQIEFLTAQVEAAPKPDSEKQADEYEMVVPMGEETELIAAHTIEQIARRLNFPPQAINQIKTAVVEACINATEHSLSPDRKIYQRVRVESDKLVITVASRGLMTGKIPNQNGDAINPDRKTRRGWGLKLIKTLMDEVQFERVDDGTQLRMIKYRS